MSLVEGLEFPPPPPLHRKRQSKQGIEWNKFQSRLKQKKEKEKEKEKKGIDSNTSA